MMRIMINIVCIQVTVWHYGNTWFWQLNHKLQVIQHTGLGRILKGIQVRLDIKNEKVLLSNIIKHIQQSYLLKSNNYKNFISF